MKFRCSFPIYVLYTHVIPCTVVHPCAFSPVYIHSAIQVMNFLQRTSDVRLGVFGSWLFFWWGPNLSCSTWFLTIVSCSTTMKNNHLGKYFLLLPSILSKPKKCTFSFVGDMLMDSGINKWKLYNARSMTHVFCRFTCYFSFSWMIMNDMESVLHIGTVRLFHLSSQILQEKNLRQFWPSEKYLPELDPLDIMKKWCRIARGRPPLIMK